MGESLLYKQSLKVQSLPTVASLQGWEFVFCLLYNTLSMAPVATPRFSNKCLNQLHIKAFQEEYP